MKKILFFVLLASATLTSCFEDKGNYDYTLMEVVDLQTILDNTVFTAGQINVDYFVEVVVPEQMQNDYDFYWEYVTDDESDELVGIVCDGKDLDFVPRLIGSIDMYFVAVHKEMKTEQYAAQSINITSMCGQGWLMLGRKDGESTLSFAEPASSASGEVDKVWTPYYNFASGLNGDASQLIMQYGEYFNEVFDYEYESALWVEAPSDTNAYSVDSYDQLSTLAENRTGVAAGDDISTFKQMLPTLYSSLLLEESGHVYLKFQAMIASKFTDSPLEFDGAPLLVEKLIYPDYDGMARYMNDGFYPVIAICKDGNLKVIDVSKSSIYGDDATTGTISELYNITTVNGEVLTDFPNLGDAEIMGGMYYRAVGTEYEFVKPSIINIILKRDAAYSLLSCKGYSYDYNEAAEINYFIEYEEITIDNSAGYLTGEEVELVSGADDDGAFSYFVSGENICILSRQGQVSKLYTASDKIMGIDVNPQKTEVGMVLSNGTFQILNIENLNSPTIIHQDVYDVDEFIDLTYKYANYSDAVYTLND